MPKYVYQGSAYWDTETTGNSYEAMSVLALLTKTVISSLESRYGVTVVAGFSGGYVFFTDVTTKERIIVCTPENFTEAIHDCVRNILTYDTYQEFLDNTKKWRSADVSSNIQD